VPRKKGEKKQQLWCGAKQQQAAAAECETNILQCQKA
jgi:hypothetical protein